MSFLYTHRKRSRHRLFFLRSRDAAATLVSAARRDSQSRAAFHTAGARWTQQLRGLRRCITSALIVRGTQREAHAHTQAHRIRRRRTSSPLLSPAMESYVDAMLSLGFLLLAPAKQVRARLPFFYFLPAGVGVLLQPRKRPFVPAQLRAVLRHQLKKRGPAGKSHARGHVSRVSLLSRLGSVLHKRIRKTR